MRNKFIYDVIILLLIKYVYYSPNLILLYGLIKFFIHHDKINLLIFLNIFNVISFGFYNFLYINFYAIILIGIVNFDVFRNFVNRFKKLYVFRRIKELYEMYKRKNNDYSHR